VRAQVAVHAQECACGRTEEVELDEWQIAGV